MNALNANRREELGRDFRKVLDVLAACPGIDKSLFVPPSEFSGRQAAVGKQVVNFDTLPLNIQCLVGKEFE